MVEKKNSLVLSFFTKSLIFLFVIFVILSGVYYYNQANKVDAQDLYYRFISEYSSFNQAFQTMQKKNFDFNNFDKKRIFAKQFSGYFQIESGCEDYSDACLWNNISYKTLDGNIIAVYLGSPDIGQFRTRSGALYMLYVLNNGLWIVVDTNGIIKGPNRFGLDVFSFYIKNNEKELKLMGDKNTPYQNIMLFCDPYESNKYNGLACTYKAFKEKDYFDNMLKILY